MPHPEDTRPQRVVTGRALAAGSVGALIVALGAPYGCFKLRSSTLALDFSVPAAVFTMFLLALAVNLGRLVTRRSLLNRGEMLVAYSMMAVSCAICTMGLTGYLVPQLGALEYYATPENKWEQVLLPITPKWIMLSTEGVGADAIRYFFEGLPRGLASAQVRAIVLEWGKPLANWLVFLLALYGTSICLMAIFRKQWVDDERIVFPLVQLPMELAGEPESSKERVTPFLKNRLLWIGFVVPFVICCLNALDAYYPFMATLQPRQVWITRLLGRQWALEFRISWQGLGLAYLLSTDVSLCVWLFGLLGSFYTGLSKYVGFISAEKLSGYGASRSPDLAHFGMGALIALVVLRLWIGRRHLLAVARRALFRDSDVDDRNEPMSYRTAFWGVVAGLAVMTWWLCRSGFSLPIALLILGAAFVGFVGLTRIIAETGMPVSIVPLISSDFVVSGVGTSALSRSELAALPWTYVWDGDVRTFVMSSAAHGMRACSERRRNYRGVFFAMMLAVVLAIVASVGITLYFAYSEGGINLHNWFFRNGPRRPYDIAGTLLRAEPESADARGWITTAIGAMVMVLFTMARHQFVWWPFNPVGLPIAVVGWTHKMWFSIFLAWLIKSRVLKYGGPKLYLRLRPLFLGLVLGQYTGAAVWIVIDGINGVTGNSVFWI